MTTRADPDESPVDVAVVDPSVDPPDGLRSYASPSARVGRPRGRSREPRPPRGRSREPDVEAHDLDRPGRRPSVDPAASGEGDDELRRSLLEPDVWTGETGWDADGTEPGVTTGEGGAVVGPGGATRSRVPSPRPPAGGGRGRRELRGIMRSSSRSRSRGRGERESPPGGGSVTFCPSVPPPGASRIKRLSSMAKGAPAAYGQLGAGAKRKLAALFGMGMVLLVQLGIIELELEGKRMAFLRGEGRVMGIKYGKKTRGLVGGPDIEGYAYGDEDRGGDYSDPATYSKPLRPGGTTEARAENEGSVDEIFRSAMESARGIVHEDPRSIEDLRQGLQGLLGQFRKEGVHEGMEAERLQQLLREQQRGMAQAGGGAPPRPLQGMRQGTEGQPRDSADVINEVQEARQELERLMFDGPYPRRAMPFEDPHRERRGPPLAEGAPPLRIIPHPNDRSREERTGVEGPRQLLGEDDAMLPATNAMAGPAEGESAGPLRRNARAHRARSQRRFRERLGGL